MKNFFGICVLCVSFLLGGCSKQIDSMSEENGTTMKSQPGVVTLQSTNEGIIGASGSQDDCAPQQGEKIMKGDYILEFMTQQGKKEILELGQLEFLSDSDKKVDQITLGDNTVFVYYQYANCANINAHFVLYEPDTGLHKMLIEYPSADQFDDVVQTIAKLSQENVDQDGINITTFPNGIGTPYDLYFTINGEKRLENIALVEYGNTDYEIKTSSIESIVSEYSSIKKDEFFSIQPLEISQEMLKNVTELEGYNATTQTDFDNGVSLTVYEFTEASSFEYIVNVTKDQQQLYLFTNVINYAFSDDGRYLYLDNYVYNDATNTYDEKWRIIDVEKKVKHTIPYSYCMNRNGAKKFYDNSFLAYGQASVDEAYGSVDTEICIVNVDTLDTQKFLTKTSRMACSAACPVDQIGLLPNDTKTLYIKRTDPSYFEDFEQTDTEETVSILSLYDVGAMNQGYRDQKHIYVWDDSLANMDYEEIGIDSDVSTYLDAKQEDQ